MPETQSCTIREPILSKNNSISCGLSAAQELLLSKPTDLTPDSRVFIMTIFRPIWAGLLESSTGAAEIPSSLI